MNLLYQLVFDTILNTPSPLLIAIQPNEANSENCFKAFEEDEIYPNKHKGGRKATSIRSIIFLYKFSRILNVFLVMVNGRPVYRVPTNGGIFISLQKYNRKSWHKLFVGDRN